MGFAVESYEDGSNAWKRLQAPDPPHLLLVDWILPGMDGLKLIQKVMSLNSRASFYIIMLTGLSSPNHITSALEAGANDYMLKPYDFAELRARINVAMRVLNAEADLLATSESLKQLAEERARQLLHADKMATIGTLSASIAHEINNPATFITGNIKVLEECIGIITDAITPEMQKHFDKRTHFAFRRLSKLSDSIRNGINRITKISFGLKSYSRKSTPNVFKPVVIESVIEQALALCHNRLKYRITTRVHIEKSPLVVSADEQQLVQILVNLLLNAADALDGVENASITVSATLLDKKIAVDVEDNGSGIPDAAASRIFDPFFTTKEIGKGTGLGLSISNNIAQAHGGTLEAISSSHGGTIFRLTLPMVRDQQAMVAAEFLESQNNAPDHPVER